MHNVLGVSSSIHTQYTIQPFDDMNMKTKIICTDEILQLLEVRTVDKMYFKIFLSKNLKSESFYQMSVTSHGSETVVINIPRK